MKPDEYKLLQGINGYWNSTIRYQKNNTVQTANESQMNGGDCNDYVAAKGETLVMRGFDPAKLKVIIARTKSGEFHSVLGYVGDDPEDPLILDNREAVIKNLSQKKGLENAEIMDYSTFAKSRSK